jgi:hypothetical protein
MVELLLALPAVLLLGLGIAQYTLIYQAKHALDYALTQSARQGAVDHASPSALRRGLAAGLVPYLYGASDWAGLIAAEAKADDHVAEGLAAGWIVLRQRSPSQESFDDWAAPALDPMGEVIAGLVEIPNDNLDNRRTRAQPVSGVAGTRLAEPIGRASGQTLADANLLRLEVVYGVRLSVPVVGSLIVRTLSAWNGCASAAADRDEAGGPAGDRERLGLLSLGPVRPLGTSRAWMCRFYEARDREGRADGRIPLRLSATLRMMSTARRADSTRPREDPASGLPSLGVGRFDGTLGALSPGDRNDSSGAVDDARPRGAPAPQSPAPLQAGLANGFLGIGSDRSYPLPTLHPALCPG